MASAYLYHISKNHPFLDGNKRTSMAAALVFLDINGITLTATWQELYALAMRVATGDAEKAEIAAELRRWA
jgi:death-on-curing protein